MRRWVPPITSLLVLGLVLGACGDDDVTVLDETTTTEADDEVETTTTTGADAALEPVEGPSVELLDAGAEPRVELRFDPAEGSVFEVTVRQEQDIELVAGEERDRSTSVTEMDLRYEVRSVDPEEIEVVMDYEATRLLDADPAARAVLEDLLSRFEGAEARAVFDRRGRILQAAPPDVDLGGIPGAADVMAALGDQLAALAMPFPEEPVGVGGSWRVTSTASFADVIGAETDVVMTITDIEDDVVSAQATLVMHMTSTAPGLEIVSDDLSGEGAMTWPLRGIVAFGDQRLSGLVVMETQGQRIEQHMTQVFTITQR